MMMMINLGNVRFINLYRITPKFFSVFSVSWGADFKQNSKILEILLRDLILICTVVAITTRVGTLIVATIYLQLIQNRYMFRSFTVLQCSHQYCVQPAASDVEVVGYL